MTHGRNYFFWCIALVFFILISGCSTTGRKDGPPPFDVDVSKIPNAKPKPEKLAKYGNMPVYHVNGQDYYVMNTAHHYEERGIASWYGMKFHAQRTSSGEPYNLLAMTAAHKTLPLPTYVQVTNLQNGKKVIVKVNDRGPFASNRIIDLSYVAAKKLGMLGRGTAYVDVKAIDPTEAHRHPQWLAAKKTKSHMLTAQRSNQHPVFLQVGAFKNKVYAENLKKRLTPLISSPIQMQSLNHLYRVKIGPINNVATEDNISKKLRAIGLTPKHTKV